MKAAWLLVGLAGCGRFGFFESDAPHDAATIEDSDGASLDAGLDAFVCPYTLCDGFEGTQFGNGWVPSNAVAIDTFFAHSGASSVHFHIGALNAGQTGNALLAQHTVLQTAGPLWIRAWIRIAALPTGSNHMELMCGYQTSGAGNGACVFLEPANTSLYTQFSSASMQGSPPPTNTWFCFAWNYVRSSTSGALHLTSDVIPPIDLVNTQTDSATSPIDTLAIGPDYTGTNTPNNEPATDIWMDDVAISTTALTCP